MPRYKRDVLAMNEKELRIASALAGPQRNANQATTDQLRERVLKWMFEKNLSMRHEFVFEDSEGELFILMGRTCTCCEDHQPEVEGRSSSPPENRVRFTRQSSSGDGITEDSVKIEAGSKPPKRSSIPAVFIPKRVPSPMKVVPVTDQPVPSDPVKRPSPTNGKGQGKANGKKKDEEDEKNQCCCCQLYRECGLMCMNINC